MTRLVLQAPDLNREHIAPILALARPQGEEAVSETVIRLLGVPDDEETRIAVRDTAFELGIDAAYIPDEFLLSSWKTLVMDMDSTLINIECIDEIAGMINRKAEVSEITESAMRGEIDFKESLRRRVALLEGTPVDALGRVYAERLMLNPGAERLIATVHQAGLKTLLVSGGFTFFTDRVRDRLQLTAAYSNTLAEADGHLTGKLVGDILDAEAKATHLRAFAAKYDAQPSQAIALGDGANDLKMMAAAGMGVANHAKPIVRHAASQALNVSGLDGLLAWFDDVPA